MAAQYKSTCSRWSEVNLTRNTPQYLCIRKTQRRKMWIRILSLKLRTREVDKPGMERCKHYSLSRLIVLLFLFASSPTKLRLGWNSWTWRRKWRNWGGRWQWWGTAWALILSICRPWQVTDIWHFFLSAVLQIGKYAYHWLEYSMFQLSLCGRNRFQFNGRRHPHSEAGWGKAGEEQENCHFFSWWVKSEEALFRLGRMPTLTALKIDFFHFM